METAMTVLAWIGVGVIGVLVIGLAALMGVAIYNLATME